LWATLFGNCFCNAFGRRFCGVAFGDTISTARKRGCRSISGNAPAKPRPGWARFGGGIDVAEVQTVPTSSGTDLVHRHRGEAPYAFPFSEILVSAVRGAMLASFDVDL
jgi:hypothetical protein